MAVDYSSGCSQPEPSYGAWPTASAVKQKLLAIGVYPAIPLARARQAREDARRLLADGLDPAVEKNARPKLRLARRPFMALPIVWRQRL
jgi:hypothetical protein